ncbi:alpha/beta hydrolase [Marinibactrum halimedae]|uniref:Alpha/beta hydrolase fold-3 domain-containing protein n=1 Tax=Marinibactrum halimedae TaxID=1444977 RepID=A0AA37WME6_9GAMM|nr:alpha/beta hydrolase [Marinibactrum halimedae]MCD9457705.1 alpha/beta hydrolase [Marinibactrum halimedae]GLS24921.1 hypothetical protein GCM10007877_06350 [Marinibactrum halimedae]
MSEALPGNHAGLNQVIQHLRLIAEMTLTSGAHPLQKRSLLEMYFSAAPQILNIEANITPELVGELPCEWVCAEGVDTRKRILYLHGGSWMAGSAISHRSLTSRLSAATGCAVLSLNYRLAPEYPFPAGLEDSIHGLQWLHTHGPDGESPSHSLYIAGDSAGANIALATLLALKQGNKTMPNAAVVFSPPTDLHFKRDFIKANDHIDPILSAELLPYVAANYVQEQSNFKDPLVSPIYGDLSDLPPILVQVGEAEILLEDSTHFAEAATAAGSPVTLSRWPNMPHVFQGFAPLLPEATQAIEEVAHFLKEHTSSTHTE